MFRESFYEEIDSEYHKNKCNNKYKEAIPDPIYIEMNKSCETSSDQNHQQNIVLDKNINTNNTLTVNEIKDSIEILDKKHVSVTPRSSVKVHHQSTSSTSSVSTYSSNSEEQKQIDNNKSNVNKKIKQNYIRNSSREDETVYTEIVTRKKITEKTKSRVTRQSENLILREDFDENSVIIRRAHSLHNLSFGENTSPINNSSQLSTKDTCKTRHEHLNARHRRSNTLHRSSYIEGDKDVIKYVNLQCFSPINTKNNKNKQKRTSVYSNVSNVYKLYENFSNNEDSDDGVYKNVVDLPADYDGLRNRSTSHPIDIIQSENSEQLHYSHIDFNGVSYPTSSPISSICSSQSSEVSSFASNSLSPSCVNQYGKRAERYSTWTNSSSFGGLNYYPAHYLGNITVSNVNKESVDTAVSTVAQNTNVLEMKPVYVEVTSEFIRFGTAVTSWDLLVTFAIDEVVSFEVVLKNAFFFGIIACKTGNEARCYVLHTEKANEIYDAIMNVFQTCPKVSSSKSLYDLQFGMIQPEFHRFHYIVKIGSVAVKKCFPNVNEYIEIALNKVNPKDYRNVSLEVLGSNILVIDASTGEEQCHYISWILSLGIFSKDYRYFGYVLSKSGTNGKTKCFCHVYRASRNHSATQVVEAISLSSQKTYSPKETSQVSPVYSEQYSTFSGSYSSLNSNSTYRSSNISVEVSNLCNKNNTTCTEEAISLSDRTLSDSHLLNTNTESEETSFTVPDHQLKPLQRLDSGIGEQSSYKSLEYCADQIMSSPTEMKFNKDCKKKFKPTKLMEKFRRSLVLPSETPTIDTEPSKEFSLYAKPQLKEYKFQVKYICSTIITPPLKSKHIRKCYKQFLKEMAKGGKLVSNTKCIGGSLVGLEINLKGITMTDPNQNNYTIRTFSFESLENIVTHPDGLECFGFSTSDPSQKCKHKMHLFSAPLNRLMDIKSAFENIVI
ncbi:uncharacterized protein LOC101237664 [Hydra vulgaris]|uniref:uncharacterized protein LOC101237664 n=1 Tax=Hydra vulgaris TaxID=6087 RepID=UPI000640CD12|nr:uncharacterized protein LOC101237664 [Hydra vulgaris]